MKNIFIYGISIYHIQTKPDPLSLSNIQPFKGRSQVGSHPSHFTGLPAHLSLHPPRIDAPLPSPVLSSQRGGFRTKNRKKGDIPFFSCNFTSFLRKHLKSVNVKTSTCYPPLVFATASILTASMLQSLDRASRKRHAQVEEIEHLTASAVFNSLS